MFYSSNLQEFLSKLTFALTVIFVAVMAFQYRFEPIAQVDVRADDRLTLIIDPGHGGEDGGAVTSDGVLESEINFRIAEKLQLAAGFMGTSAVMTRESLGIEYPEAARSTRERKNYDQRSRVELINSYPNAVLISIHQNKFPDGRPRGPQVLYARTEGSQEFGEIAHGNLLSLLYPESRRVAAPISESIYITKMITCPAILVECGFLSNRTEAELLQDPDYQRKLALVLLGSYLQYTEGSL